MRPYLSVSLSAAALGCVAHASTLSVLSALPSPIVSVSPVLDRETPPASPADQVSIDRLLESIRALPSKRAARSNREHHEGLLETETILLARLRTMGYDPVLEVVDAIGLGRGEKGSYHNIIVHIKGRGGVSKLTIPAIDPSTVPVRDPDATGPSTTPKPAASTETRSAAAPDQAPGLLIVGAHFDAVPGSPGADDNGTGVAALLEIAHLLKDRPMKHDVRLCFFNLEECGLVGSTIHAATLKDTVLTPKTQRVIGMISLDMLGYYSDQPGSQKSPIPEMEGFKPPDTADFIAMATVLRHRKFSQALTRAMKETSPGLKVVTVDFLPIALPDLLRSDHAPFLAIGVPAVIVSDTANFRSAHYHQPTDTIDTLDKERFAMTVKGLVGAVHRLAEPIEAPVAPGANAEPSGRK